MMCRRSRASLYALDLNGTRHRLIIDCDTGIDDALALLYAIASPEVQLVAVTTVGGNVGAERAARNSLSVLELAGVTDVEVAVGGGGRGDRTGRHGPAGLGHATLPDPSRAAASRTAARTIVDEARARPGELVLVATAPLTNVARALTIDPELPHLLGGVTIGGGAYGPGTSGPETNMRIDPGAARAAFDAFRGGPVLPMCVGLDVTERTRITARDIAWLRDARGNDAIARFVDDAASFAIDRFARERGFDGAPLHDPMAVAATIDPASIRLEPGRVDVDETGLTTFHPSDDANARVARDVDADAFTRRVLERLAAV
jgi:purine nucleosidase